MLRKFDGDEQANLDMFFVAQRLKFKQVNASTEYSCCMHSATAVTGSGQRQVFATNKHKHDREGKENAHILETNLETKP